MDSLPSKKTLMNATLVILKENNAPMAVPDINNNVAKYLKIPDYLLEIEDTNFSGTEYSYRMRWVRTDLKNQGLIVSPSRGFWKLA